MKKYILIVGLIVLVGLGYLVENMRQGNPTIIDDPRALPTDVYISVVPTSLPEECKDQSDFAEDTPIIFSLSKNSGTTESEFEIVGCNFNGFEGDLNAWIENEEGERALLRGQSGSTPRLINVRLEPRLCKIDTSYSGLPCEEWLELQPGDYKIYVELMKKSNELKFVIGE